MKKLCEVCGLEMECIKANKKYCSKDCENKARRNRRQQPIKNKVCPICEKFFTPKTGSANLRKCCYECHPDGETLTRGKMLELVKRLHGGKCVRCGYDKCSGALEFHHIDASQKDFTISNDRAKLEESIEESKKCILLCANCHRELHAEIFKITEVL